MARNKKSSVAAINIRVHPEHKKQTYINLIHDAFKLQKSIKVRGDQHIKLATVYPVENNGSLIRLEGTLARFTEIDKNAPWYDVKKNAEIKDTNNIDIPESLKPNFSGFNYIFYPKSHLFVFETYSDSDSLSPRIVYKFLLKLFSSKFIEQKYGKIDINVLPSEESVTHILSIPTLSHLDLEIERPNPDDLASAEAEFLKRMADQKLSKITSNLTAIRGESITPDKNTKLLAKIAAKNGKVVGSGKSEDGTPIKLSTEEIPAIIHMVYDTDLYSSNDVFKKLASKMLSKFKNFLSENNEII